MTAVRDVCCLGIPGIVPLLGSAWLTFYPSRTRLTDNIPGPVNLNVAYQMHVENAIASKFDQHMVHTGNIYFL